MTKKHYEMVAESIADVIRPYDPLAVQSLVYEIIDNLADNFEKDNPKFNRTRFLEACGIEQITCTNVHCPNIVEEQADMCRACYDKQ